MKFLVSQKILPSTLMVIVALLAWEGLVRSTKIPPYVLPAPSDIFASLIQDGGSLYHALLVTLRICFIALSIATLGAISLAILFVQSIWIERALLPLAVVLQVTPIIAIAPLLLIYLPNTEWALIICAAIIAFFPILANTAQGLVSVDPSHMDLFRLYKASRWQVLWWLQFPTALPHIMTGLRIAGGLALIGAVAAEFVAGSAGVGSGLAWRLIEAGYRLEIPRMFAALFLLAATGIAIYAGFSGLTWLVLHRWHEPIRRNS
ncbi:MAG: ABC transporter permease [Alphaproteobacteria bacterium]